MIPDGERLERIEEWRSRGSLPFRHYGDDSRGEIRSLNFSFYEDSVHHDPRLATITQPTRAFHGWDDKTVLYPIVEQFARVRPNVELNPRHDNHRLDRSLEFIWNVLKTFLELK
jgi:hypothetical protein